MIFKKYSGIKACEDMVQRFGINGDSSYKYCDVRHFKNVNGTDRHYLYYYGSNVAYTCKNLSYLCANQVKASTDDYDADDYNGNFTGNCQYNCTRLPGGIVYAIQVTATESATIKCFKVFRELSTSDNGSSLLSESVLMFAFYFDEPISVTAGQILSLSLLFAYDENQITII